MVLEKWSSRREVGYNRLLCYVPRTPVFLMPTSPHLSRALCSLRSLEPSIQEYRRKFLCLPQPQSLRIVSALLKCIVRWLLLCVFVYVCVDKCVCAYKWVCILECMCSGVCVCWTFNISYSTSIFLFKDSTEWQWQCALWRDMTWQHPLSWAVDGMGWDVRAMLRRLSSTLTCDTAFCKAKVCQSEMASSIKTTATTDIFTTWKRERN